MDDSLRRAVRAAAQQVNPRISRSCPLSELAHGVLKLAPGTAEGDKMRSQLVQRFVLYSKAPPAMLHVNHLVSCYNIPTTDVGAKPSSQSPGDLDPDKFVEFFTPQPAGGNTPKAKAKKLKLSLFGVESATVGDEDCMLRDALLEACERLGMQFGSLSPTPREFLMQRLASPAAPMTIANNNKIVTSNQDSLLDIVFTNVIENSLVKFEESNDKSSIQLVEFIVMGIKEASNNFSTEIALAERLIFSLMPHPEASAGSRVLLEGFQKAIYWVRSELELVNDAAAVEALVAATDRLETGNEVKELFKKVMRETSLIDWDVFATVPLAFGMKLKFKIANDIPKGSSTSKVLKKSTFQKIKTYFQFWV